MTEEYNAKTEKYQCDVEMDRDYFVKRWMQDLTLIEGNKFEYESLPVNLPAFELERRFIQQGFTVAFKHNVYGLVTMWGSRSGVGIYNNATMFTGAQPALGSVSGLVDGVDCIIGYNTSLDKPYSPNSVVGSRLTYYANILGDLDLSLSMISESSRAMNTLGAKTDNAVNVIAKWYDSLRRGKRYVPLLETGIFESTVPMISKDCADARALSNDLNMLKTAYMKQFYNSCGISYIMKKEERMITDEVQADEDMLSINIIDQLNCRAEFVSRVNALYGTHINVHVRNMVIT